MYGSRPTPAVLGPPASRRIRDVVVREALDVRQRPATLVPVGAALGIGGTRGRGQRQVAAPQVEPAVPLQPELAAALLEQRRREGRGLGGGERRQADAGAGA